MDTLKDLSLRINTSIRLTCQQLDEYFKDVEKRVESDFNRIIEELEDLENVEATLLKGKDLMLTDTELEILETKTFIRLYHVNNFAKVSCDGEEVSLKILIQILGVLESLQKSEINRLNTSAIDDLINNALRNK